MAVLLEELTPFEFEHVETQLECFASRDASEMLMQWNVDATMRVERFTFKGTFNGNIVSDYDRILRDFFRDSVSMAQLEISGAPTGNPPVLDLQAVGTGVMSMDFFDRLEAYDIVSSVGGQIRGCFEEYFDGIQCGDKLREVLVNPDSENASIYKESERLELIYILFRLLVIGGSMCQPDDRVERYLSLTKGFYKDLLTVYKDASSGEVAVSGKVFKIKAVQGLEFFSNPDKDLVNVLLVYVDAKKKQLVVIKNDYKPFW